MFFSRYLACLSGALGITLVLTSQHSAAQAQSPDVEQTNNTCPVQEYILPKQPKTNVENGLFVSSKQTYIEKNKYARFTGDVLFTSKDKKIQADILEYNQAKNSINASGEIHFKTENVDIFADQLSANETTKSTNLSGTHYQLANSQAHGKAGTIQITENGTLQLLNSDFTTCPGDKPAWQIRASEISISTDDNFGDAYHTTFHIMDVPVLYLPYINFPVTDQRKSGFLYPNISTSSKLGTVVSTPYYWNIAPNMDATFTPNIMSNIGNQLVTEYRYLAGDQEGTFDLEYLAKDKNQDVNDERYRDSRYLMRFRHNGTFADNFRAYIDTTTMSDDNYLVDIGSSHYNSNDAYLYQSGELAYFGNNWNLTGKLQDFEIIGNHQSSYKTLPQLEFNARIPTNFLNSRLNVYSELSRFTNADDTLPTANRYHIEAGYILPISTPAWFLNSEVKILHTSYQQDNLAADSLLDKHVERTLPKVRFHGGINLFRELGSNGYTQTLEPQVQYFYIPEKDQSNIGIYDSALLREDYQALFRDRRYSGLDRIEQANQYAWGLTSRILTSANDEIFRISIGRIVYLNDKSPSNNTNKLNASTSALAAESFYQINQKWQLSGNIQYDTQTSQTQNGQLSLNYRNEKKYSGQLNHRYVKDVSGVALEQLSLLGNININEDWKLVSRVSQDLRLKRSLETYAGVQYESCCWAVRMSYHRHIESNPNENIFGNENRGEFNSGFMLQFVIKGLSGGSSSLSVDEMFNESIFGYKRPYYLNN